MKQLLIAGLVVLHLAAPAMAEEDTQSLPYYRGYMAADRAYKLLADGDYAEAIPLLERAVTLMPEKREYRTQLIDTLVQEKRLARASQVTEEGLALHPDELAWQTRKQVIDDMLRPIIIAAPEPVPEPIVEPVVAAPKPRPATAPSKVVAAPTTFTRANDHYQRALTLQKQTQENAAIAELEQAQALMPDNDVFAVSLAYAYRHAGRNAEAIPLFRQSLVGSDNPMVREDMAWAMKEEGMREDAAEALAAVLPATKDADKHYALRREIQQLEDNWTSVGSLTYRDGLARSSGIPGLQNYNETLQYGFETVYSPDQFQRNGRRLLQLYGQAFASSNNAQYDLNDNTTQGAVGVRTMPVPDVEWYLYGARLFRIGSQAINDWQLRTTYSYTQGFDIDPNRDDWFYLFATPDISYLTDREELFASFEGRVGQSYRFSNWVLTPHLVGAAAHNHNDFDSRDSLEYGPGLSVKYWFDETAERAPTGSAELIFQWREAVGPSEDRDGPFVRLVFQY